MASFQEFVAKQRQSYAIIEGSVGDAQVAYIQNLISKNDVKRVLEIGFNGGLSSAAFLSARPDVTVVSFDLGVWDYVLSAKRLIDATFPGRHTLVIGDSTRTVPEFQGEFDLAFIDGGHTAPVPALDIANSLRLLKPGGLVLVDDYCAQYGSDGVIAAYDHAVESGAIKTIDGPHAHQDRGWVLARKV